MKHLMLPDSLSIKYVPVVSYVPLSSTLAVYKMDLRKQEGPGPESIVSYGVTSIAQLESLSESSIQLDDYSKAGVNLSAITGSPSDVDGALFLISAKDAIGFYARQFTLRQVMAHLASHAISAQELFEELAAVPEEVQTHREAALAAVNKGKSKAKGISPDRCVVFKADSSDLLLTANGMPLMWLGSAVSVTVEGNAAKMATLLQKARSTNAIVAHDCQSYGDNNIEQHRITFRVNENFRETLLMHVFKQIREESTLRNWKQYVQQWLEA